MGGATGTGGSTGGAAGTGGSTSGTAGTGGSMGGAAGMGGSAGAGGVGRGAATVTMACVVAARLLVPLMLCDEIGGMNGYRGGV